MKRCNEVALALTLIFAVSGRAFAQDKPTLIEEVIPEDLREFGRQAGAILSVYTGTVDAVGTIESIVEAFGLIHPATGPTMQELFTELTMHLDSIAGSLDWKIDATARAERYGKMMSAVDGVMLAMMLSGSVPGSLIAQANADSTAVLREIESPDGVSFQRLYQSSVTSGSWQSWISSRPTVTNGQVYDWRLGIPELLEFIALRQQVMAAVAPNFMQSGIFRTEMLQHRAFLRQQYNKMVGGVKCASDTSGCNLFNYEECYYAISCADIHTGSWDQGAFSFFDFEQQKLERVARQVKRKMPLFEMRAMIDTLFAFANPFSESLTSPGSIRSWGAAGTLCLEVVGGSSAAGTPVRLAPCDFSPKQTWVYDRQQQTVFNTGSQKCLDVRDADIKSGTTVQIWGCNGTDAQRWSWDPETFVVENALGTVLDVQWGVFATGTPVWTWERSGATAQQWIFPEVFDGFARCVASGEC